MRKLMFMTALFMGTIQFASAHFNDVGKPVLNQFKFSPPAIAFTQNDFFDIDLYVDIPCAGEQLILAGTLHIQSHVTINDNMIVVKSHYQPQGISGYSSISGVKYQATGVSQDIFKGSLTNGQYTATSVNNFRIIGQGPGNNLLIHFVFHVTLNADGTLTALVDNFSYECK
jgi:hypothetical protein